MLFYKPWRNTLHKVYELNSLTDKEVYFGRAIVGQNGRFLLLFAVLGGGAASYFLKGFEEGGLGAEPGFVPNTF